MKVYCVLRGYDYESTNLIAVFSNIESANEYVRTDTKRKGTMLENGTIWVHKDSQSWDIQIEEVRE